MIQRVMFALTLLLQTPATPGTISGKVLFPDGSPAVNARVWLVSVDADSNGNSTESHFVETNSTGGYRTLAPPGRYYVFAGTLSAPTYFPGSSSRAGAEIISITSGAVRNGVDILNFTGKITYLINGRFIPPPQSPASLQLNGGSAPMETPVLPDGSFSFNDVPPKFIALNLRTAAGKLVGLGGFTVNDDVNGLVALGGRVAMDDASAATVPSNYGTQMEFSAEVYGTYTDHYAIREDGSFTLLLPEGVHRIDLRNIPPAYNVRSMTSGNINLLTTPLMVSSAAPPNQIQVSLVPSTPNGVTVSGQIKFGSGGRGNSPVYLEELGRRNHTRRTTPGSDGSFEFTAVPPGTYIVTAFPTGPISANVVIRPDFSWIQVGNENIQGVEIRGFNDPSGPPMPDFLSIPPAISGHVRLTDSGGTAQQVPAGMMIHLSGGLRSTSSVRTDGTFALPVSTGKQSILLSGVPFGYTIKSMTLNTADLMKTPLNVDASAPPTEEIQINLEFSTRR